MVTRNSRYAWMTLGGVLCLFGLALACKLRDGNRAHAQSVPPAPVASDLVEPPRIMPDIGISLPAITPPELPAVKVPLTPTPEVIPAAAVLPNTPTPPVSAGSTASPILIPASGTAIPSTPKVEIPPIPGVSDPTPPVPSSAPSTSPVPSVPLPTPLPTPTPSIVEVIPPPTTPITHPAAPDEPPLAPNPGPVMMYKVTRVGETFKTLARKMLGTAERWSDIHKLNPTLPADVTIVTGATVRLPADACVTEDGEVLRALPTLRPRVQPKARAVLPLTGTFSLTLDSGKGLTLPRAIQQQLGGCDTVLVSPGSDRCLWITNQAHLDRLQAKLDKSPARESDIRGFKRLYYAQTVKVGVKEGRVQITDKLAQFADLGAEVVLVGIDDHFEVWDAARWKKYTQTKKAISTEE